MRSSNSGGADKAVAAAVVLANARGEEAATSFPPPPVVEQAFVAAAPIGGGEMVSLVDLLQRLDAINNPRSRNFSLFLVFSFFFVAGEVMVMVNEFQQSRKLSLSEATQLREALVRKRERENLRSVGQLKASPPPLSAANECVL